MPHIYVPRVFGGTLKLPSQPGTYALNTCSRSVFRTVKHRVITCLLRSESPHVNQSLRYEQSRINDKLRSELQ